MSVGQYCNRDVVVVAKQEPVQEAIRLMRRHHVGDVVVVDSLGENVKPVGILTDRDIVLEILAQDIDMNTVRISDVMTYKLLTVTEDTSILDAIELMREKAVRRLPVVNASGFLVGIITVDDILEIITEQLHGIVSLVARQNKTEQVQRQ
jgi:CBS domain-containing protein